MPQKSLIKVLDHLEVVGLKVSLDKCLFCQPKVKYVGHLVLADGIAKVKAVIKRIKPTDLKLLMSFPSFFGYWCGYVATIPLLWSPWLTSPKVILLWGKDKRWVLWNTIPIIRSLNHLACDRLMQVQRLSMKKIKNPFQHACISLCGPEQALCSAHWCQP